MTRDAPAFPREEYDERLARVRAAMAERGLAGLLVAAPENICYLTGLDHQGFFAFHLLVVPLDGAPTLVTRAMERATIEALCPDLAFVGYRDGADPTATVLDVLGECGLRAARLGIEADSHAFPPRIYAGIVSALEGARVEDGSGLVAGLRLVKSPRELAYSRAAAQVSLAMMRAAMETARPGVNERAVAAEVHRRMILAGGEHPGFAPFIRPTPRLAEEHTTWTGRDLVAGEVLFVELAGCVRRYHAPMGRLLYLGAPPPGSEAMRAVCEEAFDAVVAALVPGVPARQVYAAWQAVVDGAGLSHYRRHHCGYVVGLAFPPSWTGGSSVVGLRHDSDMPIRAGMVLHLLSWLMGTGRGDYFLSNTVAVGASGAEVLTPL